MDRASRRSSKARADGSCGEQQMNPEATQLFDIHAATKYLHSIGAMAATEKFVRSLIRSGQLPHVRIGKAFYVSKTAVDVWLVRAEKRTRP
jgi:excisionase family DNA binding protein